MFNSTPVVTVSQLNRHIKNYLEQEIGTVYVEGELSNLSKPSSGHMYFTLKDNHAQIRCAFFKNRHNGPLSLKISDGQHVIATGKLSLFEARGDYQLIVEGLKEAGLGELFLQFEALKNKLAAEGLFHPERKRALPKIPKTIGIITSTSGAAIQDILSTLGRRFPLAAVFIYPSEVQGATAAEQLIKAVQFANAHNRCDVLILARGGGSMEDLWSFNHELLARHIAASAIPIVSGVGHETDFTIADFVADYRAETPTAAATAVTPNREELQQIVNQLMSRLQMAIQRHIQNQQIRLEYLISKISSPRQIIITHWQSLDYLEKQLIACMQRFVANKSQDVQLHLSQLQTKNPIHHLQHIKIRIDQIMAQLVQHMKSKINGLSYQFHNNLSTLHAVSPLATLDRGYSISCQNGKVLYNTKGLKRGDGITVRLAEGSLDCEIKELHE
jgi:exodeoxyribonuclease VII large subunit